MYKTEHVKLHTIVQKSSNHLKRKLLLQYSVELAGDQVTGP